MTLRDIEDGRLGLYCQVRRFDELTGNRWPPPVIASVGADQYPSAYPGVPDHDGEWWWPMLEAGLLYLTHERDGQPLQRARLYVTDSAARASRDAGLRPCRRRG